MIEVAPGIYRSALPRARDLAEFAGRGGRTVVDLTQRPRPLVERHCARLGICYRKFPLPYDGGDVEGAAQFILGCERSVLFHCFHGRDRAGTVARQIIARVGPSRPYAVALINEKNDRTFTRIYRLCAFFGVPRLFAIECPAEMRGNVYSASGQVSIQRLNLSGFREVHDGNGFWYVLCDPFKGHSDLAPTLNDRLVLLLDCNRRGTPKWIRERSLFRFHLPTVGQSPELCTDQAAAIALSRLVTC